MSVRGVRKAVVRAPHIFVGNKSPENLTVIEYTKAVTEAEKGLDEIVAAAKAFRTAWTKILSTQEQTAKYLLQLYEPIPEEDPYKAVRETPQSSLDAVTAYHDVLAEIQARVAPILDTVDVALIQKCTIVKGHIEAVRKALKKREHKKIDFDRFTNAMERVQRKTAVSEKDDIASRKLQADLDRVTAEFELHDRYVQDVVPAFIGLLSEFLHPLSMVVFMTEEKILQTMTDLFFPFAQAQGLGTYTHSIENEWREQFLPIQRQAEEDIKTVANGKAVKDPMTLPSADDSSFDKLKHIFRRKSARRPPGTDHTGAFRSFSDQSASVSRTSSFVTSSEPDEHPIGVNPVLFNRSLSLSRPASSRRVDPYLSRPRSLSHPVGNGVLEMPEPPLDATADYMTAVYTFIGLQPADLSFNVGDRIRILSRSDEDWWTGETLDGRRGEFPGNYVR
ncbi:uncharacterized protein V1510DRAFT_381590 [Dipodascopsis tothii]|uniref:uncharacterized protein n=1 Tax=Dipodascopsis tothii TaxID=44089 RepID=UPI0034CFC114